MGKRHAYVGKEKHVFQPWMRKKRSWRVTCSCRRMLEKSGGLQEIEESWADHVRKEAERLEAEVFWYSYPD